MATYNSNYELAQEISARIGTEPIPFDSVHSLCLEIYRELGGAEEDFDSVYAILLATLPLIDTIADKVIDDSIITTAKTWSSSKINTQLSGKQDSLTAGEGIGISGSTITVVGKQDTINDLDTIRSGAALGATALQSVPSEYITDSELATELSGYTTVSDFNTGLAGKQDTLIAGANISISGNTISATDTTYQASDFDIKDLSDSTGLRNAWSGKQDTLTAGSGINISGNTISTIALTPTAGYNYATKYIDDDTDLEGTNVATGNFSNWAEGSKTTATSTYGGNHAEGYSTSSTGEYASHSEGYFTEATGAAAHAEGHGGSSRHNVASGDGSHVEGTYTLATAQGAHAEGYGGVSSPNTASGAGSHAEGCGTTAQNQSEHAEGANNLSHKASNSWGNAGNTLHSIGDSGTMDVKNNAVEVMQNADMYIKGIGGYQGTDTKVQNASIKTVQDVINGKQNTLTAGTNITISGNTISATDTTYSAGSGITISGNSVSVDSSLLSEINGKQDELTAGTNITISGSTISATYQTASTAEIEALFV